MINKYLICCLFSTSDLVSDCDFPKDVRRSIRAVPVRGVIITGDIALATGALLLGGVALSDIDDDFWKQ